LSFDTGITNHNAVRLQLEGLFSNPGIRVDHIMVCNFVTILVCRLRAMFKQNEF